MKMDEMTGRKRIQRAFVLCLKMKITVRPELSLLFTYLDLFDCYGFHDVEFCFNLKIRFVC